MLLGALARRAVLLLGVLGAACDGDAGGPDVIVDGGGGGGGGGGGTGGVPGAAGDGGGGQGGADATAGDVPVVDPGTPELPRTPADPGLTRRLLPGLVGLVGFDGHSCTHQAGATGDRLCAFTRPGSGDRAELWVLNVTRAATGAAVPCDGTNDGCRLLSSDIFSGMPIWGPSHPFSHRFEGDTLVFHGAPRPGMRQPFEGTIFAWRPGWPAPRALTSDRGVMCGAQPHTDVVYCLDAAVVDKDPVSSFDRPRLREFDLLAGVVGDATTGPLAKVARLANHGAERIWRLRVTAGGEFLLFSSMPTPGAPETVQTIKVADVGKAAPTTVITDAADWELSHDGTKLYFLRGYDRSRGERASGTLMLADFVAGAPAGASPVTLVPAVLEYALVGAAPDAAAQKDLGVVIAHGTAPDAVNYALLKDRARPSQLLDLGRDALGIQVAADARHTMFLKRFPGATFPVAYVTRNDGSGACQLTQDPSAETYGTGFGAGARSVFWIEYGRNRSESEEGWYALPETCGDRTKFGDFVFGYRLIGSEFVLFEGGDLADTTSWLQYTPLGKRPDGGAYTPTVIKEKPDPTLEVVTLGERKWVLFSVSQGDAAQNGLYLHGPLGSLPSGP